MSISQPRVMLINPNTSTLTTSRMLAAARVASEGRIELDAITAEFGVPLITGEEQLAVAAAAVSRLVSRLPLDLAGVIVSAFGDPGVTELRRQIDRPVVGIGEASLLEAALNSRRFCVATTTPHLVRSINFRVAQLGLEKNYAGVMLTRGEADAVTNDPVRLEAELSEAIETAIEALGVEAVVIGGGPLSDAARQLAQQFPIAIVEPIPAAVRFLCSLFKPRCSQIVE